MIQKPRLKSFLTVFPISSTTWGLRGGSDELWRINLRDERALHTFSSLLPYLTGQHTVAQLTSELEAQGVDKPALLGLLQHLEKSSVLEDAAEASGLTPEEEEHYREQMAYFSRQTRGGGAKAQAVLRRASVALIGDGALGRSTRRQLADAGIGSLTLLRAEPVEEAPAPPEAAGVGASVRSVPLDREKIWPEELGAPPRILLMAQQAHDPQLLEAVDSFSKRLGVPWLLIRALETHEGWVGPLFVPNDTACYLSLEARYRSNVRNFDEYRALDSHLRSTGAPSSACGGLHASFEVMSGIATSEVIKFLTEISVPVLAGRFLTINFATWETELHEVLRLPHLKAQATSQPVPFPWKEVPYGDFGGAQNRRA